MGYVRSQARVVDQQEDGKKGDGRRQVAKELEKQNLRSASVFFSVDASCGQLRPRVGRIDEGFEVKTAVESKKCKGKLKRRALRDGHETDTYCWIIAVCRRVEGGWRWTGVRGRKSR